MERKAVDLIDRAVSKRRHSPEESIGFQKIDHMARGPIPLPHIALVCPTPLYPLARDPMDEAPIQSAWLEADRLADRSLDWWPEALLSPAGGHAAAAKR